MKKYFLPGIIVNIITTTPLYLNSLVCSYVRICVSVKNSDELSHVGIIASLQSNISCDKVQT